MHSGKKFGKLIYTYLRRRFSFGSIYRPAGSKLKSAIVGGDPKYFRAEQQADMN